MAYEDDLSLAMALQESYMYGDDAYMYGEFDSSDEDSDYSYGSKRKSSVKKKINNAEKEQAKKRKVTEKEEARQQKRLEKERNKENLRQQKLSSGKKAGGGRKGWSELEKKLFLEAMELYGRDWHKMAQHIGHDRDYRGVKSHAQKYFIKLYLNKQPLPDKVKESGEGYTLSGNPLDPNSAALKCYTDGAGYRKLLKEKKNGGNNGSGGSSDSVQPLATDASMNGQQNKDPNQDNKTSDVQVISQKQKVELMTTVKVNRVKKREKKTVAKNKYSKMKKEIDLDAPGTRRSSRVKELSKNQHVEIGYLDPAGNMNGTIQMVRCKHYMNDNPKQPIEILVDNTAMMLMDFHAHLASSEIIGFLAGTWDPVTRLMHVRKAFPCKAIDNGFNHDAETNVEMDPESEFEVRQKISDNNLRIVGWYHSHPTFKPIPSNVDVSNQHNYQMLFKDTPPTTTNTCVNPPTPETTEAPTTSSITNHSSAEPDNDFPAPFIGAIVGPYDTELPSEDSAVNWFHVRQNRQKYPRCLGNKANEKAPCPMILQTNKSFVVDVQQYNDMFEVMDELVVYYATFLYRVENFDHIWNRCKIRIKNIYNHRNKDHENETSDTFYTGKSNSEGEKEEGFVDERLQNRSKSEKLRISMISKMYSDESAYGDKRDVGFDEEAVLNRIEASIGKLLEAWKTPQVDIK